MAEPLLAIDNLEVTFRVPDASGRSRRLVRAVRDISLRMAPREVLGIVGESGSGKSTVARAIVGLNRPAAGTIKVDGTLLPAARGAAARAGLQMVFQDHSSTLNPFQTVARILDDVMRVAEPARTAEERRTRAEGLIQRIGLDKEALERRPSNFSGGQRQRISIARALSAQPRLLICDEPTSALDVSVQAQVLALLETLKGDGLGLLFISHNLAVVRQVADRILVMYAGIVVEEGPAAQLIEAPAHPYTLALVAAAPLLADRGSLLARSRGLRSSGAAAAEGGCPFANRCPRADAACSVLPPPISIEPGWSARCHHPHLQQGRAGPIALDTPGPLLARRSC